jgi:two-component system cell cycle sensor histidine kinase/response regulator CckA
LPSILRIASSSALTRTILLVDDEPEVRRLLERMLGRLGFRVLPAQDGPEALTALAQHQEPVHLLVTDLQMPGMDGRELAIRFAELRPGAGVLFLSGNADEVDDNPGHVVVAARFLPKPFTSQQLAAEIHVLLGDTPVD